MMVARRTKAGNANLVLRQFTPRWMQLPANQDAIDNANAGAQYIP